MRLYHVQILSSLSIFFLQFGCLLRDSDESIPAWVLNPPVEKNSLFAVGACGPTFYPEDGLVRAADDARKELAKSIGGRVQSVLLIQETRTETRLDEAYHISATSWSMDVISLCAQVVASWKDLRGRLPSSNPGTTYALAMLDLSKIPSCLQIVAEMKKFSRLEIEEMMQRARTEFHSKQ